MASVLRSYDGEREGNLRPIEEYLPFVKRVAQRLARRLPSHIALEDLISAGVVGIFKPLRMGTNVLIFPGFLQASILKQRFLVMTAESRTDCITTCTDPLRVCSSR